MVDTAQTPLTPSLSTVLALDLQGVTAKRVSTQDHSNPREFDISKETKFESWKKFNSRYTDQIPGMDK